MNPKHLDLLLTGLHAGDSLGSTSEFADPREIAAIYARQRERGWPFGQVGGGPFEWRPGQPTDDTAMARCLVRSFLISGGFDGADVAQRFVEWMRSGPRDIGGTVHASLTDVHCGTPWHEGGLRIYRQSPDNLANGSLMRNGVVPALAGSLPECLEFALKQSIVTHYAPLCVLCCAAQAWWIHELLGDRQPTVATWLGSFRSAWQDWLAASDDEVAQAWRANVGDDLEGAWSTLTDAEFDADRLQPFFHPMLTDGAGYVLFTLQVGLWAAQWALRGAPLPTPPGLPDEVFERSGPWVLSWVAMLGGDADTYGATAGPLVAAACGGLPRELTEGLQPG